MQLLQQVICVCDDNHDYGDDGHVDLGDILGDGDVVGDDDHVDVGGVVGDGDHGGAVGSWM